MCALRGVSSSWHFCPYLIPPDPTSLTSSWGWHSAMLLEVLPGWTPKASLLQGFPMFSFICAFGHGCLQCEPVQSRKPDWKESYRNKRNRKQSKRNIQCGCQSCRLFLLSEACPAPIPSLSQAGLVTVQEGCCWGLDHFGVAGSGPPKSVSWGRRSSESPGRPAAGLQWGFGGAYTEI